MSTCVQKGGSPPKFWLSRSCVQGILPVGKLGIPAQVVPLREARHARPALVHLQRAQWVVLSPDHGCQAPRRNSPRDLAPSPGTFLLDRPW